MSKSNTSNQYDGDYRVHTHERGDASMLLAPAVSCWEAWRWEVTRAMLRGSSASFMHHAERSPSTVDVRREVRRSRRLP
jgi:hypothetical protein